MKILYLLGSLNRGGMESLLLDVAKAHDLVPFDMVYIHRKGGSLRDAFYESGVDICQMPSKKGRLLTYIRALSRYFATQQIDVIHTQMAIDCIYAKLALRLGMIGETIKQPVQLVTTFHGFDTDDSVFSRWLRKMAIRMADKVCFVSQYEREDYERKYPVGNKGFVIYNGVDFSKISIPTSPSSLTTHQSPIRLCMVGSFGSGRSHIVVCKALKELKSRGIDVDFSFIGARRASEPEIYDTCYDYCQKNQLNNVHFLGNCDNVYQLLSTMDGFVYSTIHDTFGIAVVEALASGLPTIVNDWAVMREITHDGQYATLFRTGDAEDCADKIQDLIEHLPERQQSAMRIAEQVRQEFSIEKHIQRLSEIYKA